MLGFAAIMVVTFLGFSGWLDHCNAGQVRAGMLWSQQDICSAGPVMISLLDASCFDICYYFPQMCCFQECTIEC